MSGGAPAGDWVVRRAEPADAAAVAELLQASRAAHLPYLPPVHTAEETRAWVVQVLLPGGGVRLAQQGGRVLAVAAHAVDNGIGWIEHLYAQPGCTGHGLGTRLMQQALAELHAQGADTVRLWCFQANTGARRFYERHGFVAVEFTDGSGNEEGVCDVLYERSSRR
jgi:GNAT superfamily N-acetyltransferase